MDERVLQELESHKEIIKEALLKKDYEFCVRALDAICDKFIMPLGIDYVNASFIPLSESLLFIACQEPKNKYIPRFIEFIEKSKAKQIVSLIPKPVYLQKDKVKEVDSFSIGTRKVFSDCEYEYAPSKKIGLIKVDVWVDYGVLSVEEMETLYKAVITKIGRPTGIKRIVSEKCITKPTVIPKTSCIVHCLAGVGRTGVLLMFIALNEFEKVNLSLFVNTWLYLRSCRSRIVESPKQLKFLVEYFLFNEEDRK